MAYQACVALDFDATLHPYTDGWQGTIPADEPPTPGALDFAQALHARGYRIVVHTCRATSLEGRVAVADWLTRHGFGSLVDEVTHEKPQAVAYVDDRAIPFDGDWPAVLATVDGLTRPMQKVRP